MRQAVHARLTAQLATSGPSGSAVEVTDHAPRHPARLFVRLEGSQVVDLSPRNCNHGRHVIRVACFSRPEGALAHGHGQREVMELQAAIDAALHGWDTLGGTVVRAPDAASVTAGQDGHTWQGLQTFYLQTGD